MFSVNAMCTVTWFIIFMHWWYYLFYKNVSHPKWRYATPDHGWRIVSCWWLTLWLVAGSVTCNELGRSDCLWVCPQSFFSHAITWATVMVHPIKALSHYQILSSWKATHAKHNQDGHHNCQYVLFHTDFFGFLIYSVTSDIILGQNQGLIQLFADQHSSLHTMGRYLIATGMVLANSYPKRKTLSCPGLTD